MTTRKWVLILFVFLLIGLGYTTLRREVDRDTSDLIILLLGLTIFSSAVFSYCLRWWQIRSETVLLAFKAQKSSVADTLFWIIMLVFGLWLTVDNLRSFHGVELGMWAANISILWSFIWLVTSHEKIIFTQTGLFSGSSFYRWRAIHSYRWQENGVELHTDGFFSPYLVTINPQQKNEVAALIYELTGKNPSGS